MSATAVQARPGRLAVTVIGGYLGAGKTTLLNRLLSEARDVRLAVLVNDFGEVNIDAALIANRDGETISLTNGCVCCSIGDNLGSTLYDLAERPDGPEHIVVETSGVADPAGVAHYAGCHPRLELDGIVVVADAETVRARADDKYVGDVVRQQLAAADLIVLSRTDLIEPAAARRVKHWIEAEVPGARVQAQPMAGRFAQLLLVGGSARAAAPPAMDDHASVFAAWRLASAQPLDGPALRCAVAGLPASVWRAKGIVALTEAPGRRFVLQVVGRRWTLEPAEIDVHSLEANRSEIIVVGLAGQVDPAGRAALFAPAMPAGIPAAVAALLKSEDRA